MSTRKERKKTKKKQDTLKKLNKDHIKCREESQENEKKSLLENIKDKDFDNTVINFFFCKCNDDYNTKSVMVEIALADINKIDYNKDDMVHLSSLEDFSNVSNDLLSQKGVSMKNIHEYIIQLFFLNRNIYVQLVEKQGKGQDADAYNCNTGVVLKKVMIIEPEPVVVEEPEPVVVEEPEPVVEKTSEPVVEKTPEPVVEKTPEPVVEKTSEPVVEKTPEPVVEKTPEPVVEKTSEPVVEKTPEPEINNFLFEETPERKNLPEIQDETENKEDIFRDSPGIVSSTGENDLEIEDLDKIWSEVEESNELDETNNASDIDTEPDDVEAFRIIDTLLINTKDAIALIDNASQNVEKEPGRNNIAEINRTINTQVNEIYSKEELLTQFERNNYIIGKLNKADVEGTTEDLVSIIKKNICNIGKVDLKFSSKVLKGFQSVLEKMNEPQLLQIEADKFIGSYTNIPECFLENEGAGKKTRRKKSKKKQRKNKTKRNKK